MWYGGLHGPLRNNQIASTKPEAFCFAAKAEKCQGFRH
jgi:hypothetical protein